MPEGEIVPLSRRPAAVRQPDRVHAVIYAVIVDQFVYIGASTNPAGRSSAHLRALRKGKHTTPAFQAAFNCFPEAFDFRILTEFDATTPEDICDIEEHWLNRAAKELGRDMVLNFNLKSGRASFVHTFITRGLLPPEARRGEWLENDENKTCRHLSNQS